MHITLLRPIKKKQNNRWLRDLQMNLNVHPAADIEISRSFFTFIWHSCTLNWFQLPKFSPKATHQSIWIDRRTLLRFPLLLSCLDFPGMCFASTRCATVEPGKSWDLTPFCGRSTCVVAKDQSSRWVSTRRRSHRRSFSNPEHFARRLQELVEDCGPLPLANDRCKLDADRTNKTAPFPFCCPKFTCEPGVQLEYPDVKTEAPPTDKN